MRCAERWRARALMRHEGAVAAAMARAGGGPSSTTYRRVRFGRAQRRRPPPVRQAGHRLTDHHGDPGQQAQHAGLDRLLHCSSPHLVESELKSIMKSVLVVVQWVTIRVGGQPQSAQRSVRVWQSGGAAGLGAPRASAGGRVGGEATRLDAAPLVAWCSQRRCPPGLVEAVAWPGERRRSGAGPVAGAQGDE